MIVFSKNWLSIAATDFRILAAIAYLSSDGIHYQGTINSLCEFFKLSKQTNNRKKIIASIENLVNHGIITYTVNKKIYDLKIIAPITEEEKIFIHKDWMLIARDYKVENKSVYWVEVLKVWLFILQNKKDLIKRWEMATRLGVSESTITRAKAILKDADIIFTKNIYEITVLENGEKTYFCLGQHIETSAFISDTTWNKILKR